MVLHPARSEHPALRQHRLRILRCVRPAGRPERRENEQKQGKRVQPLRSIRRGRRRRGKAPVLQRVSRKRQKIRVRASKRKRNALHNNPVERLPVRKRGPDRHSPNARRQNRGQMDKLKNQLPCQKLHRRIRTKQLPPLLRRDQKIRRGRPLKMVRETGQGQKRPRQNRSAQKSP